MTNFEKIKQEISKMTLEEFSDLFQLGICGKISEEHCEEYPITSDGHTQCENCIIDWLKSEAD